MEAELVDQQQVPGKLGEGEIEVDRFLGVGVKDSQSAGVGLVGAAAPTEAQPVFQDRERLHRPGTVAIAAEYPGRFYPLEVAAQFQDERVEPLPYQLVRAPAPAPAPVLARWRRAKLHFDGYRWC